MLTRLVYLLLCVSGLACAAATPPVQPSSANRSDVAIESVPQQDAADSFVLIWFDAAFYRTPADTAPLRAYDFGESARNQRAGQFFTMKVLEDRGEWLRVSDPREWLREDDSSLHCIGSDLFWVEHFAVELWVRESDLVPVLAQDFTREYDDDTFVALWPGTPIVDQRPWAQGYHLPVTVPAELVARRYQPSATGKADTPEGFSMVYVDDATFSLGREQVNWRQEVTNYAKSPLMVVNEERTRARETGGCGQFELAFTGQVRPLDQSGGMLGVLGGVIGGEQQTVRGIEISEGTELFWPGGQRAGAVVKTFKQGGARASASARTCLEIPVGTNLKTTGYRNEQVTVCVESSDVIAIETTPPLPKDFRSADNSVRVVE